MESPALLKMQEDSEGEFRFNGRRHELEIPVAVRPLMLARMPTNNIIVRYIIINKK